MLDLINILHSLVYCLVECILEFRSKLFLVMIFLISSPSSKYTGFYISLKTLLFFSYSSLPRVGKPVNHIEYFFKININSNNPSF